MSTEFQYTAPRFDAGTEVVLRVRRQGGASPILATRCSRQVSGVPGDGRQRVRQARRARLGGDSVGGERGRGSGAVGADPGWAGGALQVVQGEGAIEGAQAGASARRPRQRRTYVRGALGQTGVTVPLGVLRREDVD